MSGARAPGPPPTLGRSPKPRDRGDRSDAAPSAGASPGRWPSAAVEQRLVVRRRAARRRRSTGAEVAGRRALRRRRGDAARVRRRRRRSSWSPRRRTRDRVDLHRSAVDGRGRRRRRADRLHVVRLGAAAELRLHVRPRPLPHRGAHPRRRLRWTFLRDNIYLDYVPFFAGEDGVIRGPAGDGRVAAVARDDIAACAVAVLTGDGHADTHTPLTGPEAFTLAEAAELRHAASGRAVTLRRRDARRRRARRERPAGRRTGRSRAGSPPTPPSRPASSRRQRRRRAADRPQADHARALPREHPESYSHLAPG